MAGGGGGTHHLPSSVSWAVSPAVQEATAALSPITELSSKTVLPKAEGKLSAGGGSTARK